MGALSLMLILLVLVQRGRGGGLAGALGGPGGQSAFGSKAGDTFTVITIVMAALWGFTCAFTMWLLGQHTPDVTADENASSLSAGPGDDFDDKTSGIIIPPSDNPGGSLSSGEISSGQTPSMDLTPEGNKKDDADDTKTDDTNAAESKADDTKADETKADQSNADSDTNNSDGADSSDAAKEDQADASDQ